MKRDFVLSSHVDKPIVTLDVVGNGEAICKCGETITRSMAHIWKCDNDNCGREYSGPMLRP